MVSPGQRGEPLVHVVIALCCCALKTDITLNSLPGISAVSDGKLDRFPETT